MSLYVKMSLERAARVGDLDAVKQRLTDYNPSMDMGALAVYVAAKEGQLHIVEWLLTEKWVSCGESALMRAAEGGQLHIVQWLVSHAMATVNQIDDYGNTALLLAAKHSKLDVVKWLVKTSGSNIEHVNFSGNTALLCAARWGRLDTVQWLVKTGGSNIEHMNEDGINALVLSLWGRSHAIANWLLTEGGCRMHEDVWLNLHPESGEIPSFLMHTLLLERPPTEFGITTNIRFSSDKNSAKRMFARADKLRTRKPEWIIRKFAIVTESITKNLPQSLVTFVMAYSAPSVEEIWSTQLAVDSPRRNPVRATRKRRAFCQPQF